MEATIEDQNLDLFRETVTKRVNAIAADLVSEGETSGLDRSVMRLTFIEVLQSLADRWN